MRKLSRLRHAAHTRAGSTAVGTTVAVVVAMITAMAAAAPAGASVEHPRVVREQPAANTPHVMSGAVNKLAQVGATMYAGGLFGEVQNAARTRTYTRHNIMAFTVSTGAVTSFAPRVAGQVWALAPSADGKALYVGGTFSSVDGMPVRSLFKWDIAGNRVDPTFRPTVTGGRVSDLQVVGGRLFASGTFGKRLVALDPKTGADTGYLDLDITGRVTAPSWAGQVYRFAVDPAERRMVVIGNFSSIQDQPRRQIAMIDLAGSATLARWYSRRWDLPCHESTLWYTRDVDWSPDGSYFAVVTTGFNYPFTQRLCDTTTKWRPSNSSNARPDWVNYTGGDTLHSVAVTGAAVYVGGHQRWLNNRLGMDTKGPGAVDRPGIGAIHPVTGRALAWNPTRSRGQGAKHLYATEDGLWVASDTQTFAHQFRGRIAFVPL